jgi:hypothetical protein
MKQERIIMSEQDTTTEDRNEHTKRSKAYTKATTALRKAHAEEFRALLHAEYEAHGIAITPRLTPEERAERDAQKFAEKAAKAEAKRQAKIAALEAEIEALKSA